MVVRTGCEYCHSEPWSVNEPLLSRTVRTTKTGRREETMLKIVKGHLKLVHVEHDLSKGQDHPKIEEITCPIEFCPRCGRKLSEKENSIIKEKGE